jgi:aspartyl-tRNA(Asn)/glutamyl-tRNA(Gln) amidotransferase subunit C
LARLEFDESELDRFIPGFEQILNYFEQLGTVDTAEVEPTYHALLARDLKTPMRPDEREDSLPVDEALSEAPDSGDGHFRVPKVIE